MSEDSPIVRSYLQHTPKSAAAYETAGRFLAGANTRQSAWWPPFPIAAARGEGPFLWDEDGNRYIDLLNNYTTLIHGHAHPEITRAIVDQARKGTGWPAYSGNAGALAVELVRRIDSIDCIRFTNSGTEAGNLALQIARAVTGRRKILMARGGYHGSLTEFMTGTAGIPGELTFLADYNDGDSFRSVLREHGTEIAAVFLEPVLGAGGIIAADSAFMGAVREETSRAGALFVLDEVITFRLAPGGRQSAYDVKPDLTMLGKVIGGGLPVGAVGGRREVMNVFDPPEPIVHHAGTFNGNPLTMAAGLCAVRLLTPPIYPALEALAARLQSGLETAAVELGIPFCVNRSGSLLNLFLCEGPVRRAADRTDTEQIRLFHLAALNSGVFFAPRGMMALSTAMDEALIDEAVERLRRALNEVRNASVV